jgi:outer membrane protein assembly factor BamB
MRFSKRFNFVIWVATAIASGAGAQSISVSPGQQHPQGKLTVSGTGFAANEPIDIYFDTTDELPASSDASGNLAANSFNVGNGALPGQHWVSAVGSKDGAQVSVTVRTNWARHGFDGNSTSFNPWENVISASNVAALGLAWIVQTGGPIGFSSPMVFGSTLYVGSHDNDLYALNASTGALVWKTATGGVIDSTPAISGGLVYVGSGDGKLYAFNTADGSVAWTATTGGAIVSSPIVNGGNVYVGSEDGNVYAFDADTGTTVWTVTTLGPVEGSPAVWGGNLYIGSQDNILYVLNEATGATVWTAPLVGPMGMASPTIRYGSGSAYASGTVYAAVGSVATKPALALYTFDAAIGEPLVTPGAGYITGSTSTSLAFADGLGFGATNGAASPTPALYPFHIKGAQRESWSTANSFSSPVAASGVLYEGIGKWITAYLTYPSNLPPNSREVWSAPTGNVIEAAPTVANGYLYVGSTDGNVYAYALNAGNSSIYRKSLQAPALGKLVPDMHLKVTH